MYEVLMMSEIKKAMIDVRERIKELERRRSELWSTAGGCTAAARTYEQFLTGERRPARMSLLVAADEGVDLMARYRELYAEKSANAAIAKAQAQCLTVEIYALRAMVGVSVRRAGE
ncbi:hypothetical protein [Paraburkholderia tropica]|uniref:hypothetical protein n=1 Tax=Paraburkholderia tropica TaxID=92647 RepID=UPI0015902711|nr:hypothetical protein [Paraburkholderia tropica]